MDLWSWTELYIGGLADNIAIFQPGAYAFAGMKSKGPHVRRVFDEFIDRELNSGDFRGALDIVDRFDIPHGGIICPKRPRIFQKDILQDLAELVVNWLVLTLELSCADVIAIRPDKDRRPPCTFSIRYDIADSVSS